MHEGLEIIMGKESQRQIAMKHSTQQIEGRKKQNKTKNHTRKHFVVLLVHQGQSARDLMWRIPS